MSTTEDDPPPGTQRWLISCDESGIDGQRYYGFGTLWMSWQRRGDFSTMMRDLRERHRCANELKWNKVSRQYSELYENLIEAFFRTPWLSFHGLVVERATVRKDLHDGDWDIARRKHFTMLLTNKIQRRVELGGDRPQTFRIWVDPIASRYARADEAVEVIANNVLAQVFGKRRTVDRVITKDSKSTDSIQLCDVLLGAVMAPWQAKQATNEYKIGLGRSIAKHLGWKDLRSDTGPKQRKFNIWHFHDKTQGKRDVTTRPVKLLYPLSPTPNRRP